MNFFNIFAIKSYKELKNLITVDFTTTKFTTEAHIIQSIDPDALKGKLIYLLVNWKLAINILSYMKKSINKYFKVFPK